MAPFGLMTAGASWLAKSFSVFSCTSTLARCSSVLSATYITPVKYLSSQASGPPKKPGNGYLRYIFQQRPDIIRHFPGIKPSEIIRKVAGQWRMLTPEQKKDKMKSLVQDWMILSLHQKQIYTQLAQDDKIRYNNEIRSWEQHMVEIGRPDLVREKTLPTKRKLAAQVQRIKKGTMKVIHTGKYATASETVRSK
ncbi:transcription factor A, mitochondrial [Gymnodraco acuticeps]|uniref:Transcription factor A, mitochondrial n=1 Tax=Gymnodraco acuticeps TaxID=8218 RepID=A0A6P8W3N9_GYMAC|nr:transcription factor A, mitochondrial [Gymnodraco acuticeps]